MSKPRRTQAQRRAETYQQVLDSACRLFGERGYANTSLDDVAAECGLTTRPVYHYFGNKKALFAAESWGRVHLQLIYFGREYCPAWGHDLSMCLICSWAASKARIAAERRRRRNR